MDAIDGFSLSSFGTGMTILDAVHITPYNWLPA